MKKAILGLVTTSIFSTLNAGMFISNTMDSEFDRMNGYFNSMIKSRVNHEFNNIHNFDYPKFNIEEAKNQFIITFDLAGMNKADLDLSIEDGNRLKLKGEKNSSKDDSNQTYIRKEIFYGKFEKVIPLPENIDTTKLTTEYKDGILKVIIPKKDIKEKSSQSIDIK